MTISAEAYISATLATAHRAAETQLEVVNEAVRSISDRLEAGGDLWVFGTGHSHLIAEEVWGRAGGIASIRPILEPSLMLHEGLEKSSLFERMPGLAETLLDVHGVQPRDALLIASNSGRNAVPVELAETARTRGVLVVALTSLAHSNSVTSRAASGKRLFEVADVVIDNCGVPGDAILPRDPVAVGATSTVVGALLAQALSVGIIAEMERRAVPLATLLSLNA